MVPIEGDAPVTKLMQITISQHTFDIHPRYQEGHVLSSDEAFALNQFFLENIRNNVRPLVAKAVEATPTGFLSPDEHDAIQARITRYADDYQFKARNRTRPPTAVELIADELARARAESEAVRRGFSPTGHEANQMFLVFRQHEGIIEQAKKTLSHRRQAIEEAVGDLL